MTMSPTPTSYTPSGRSDGATALNDDALQVVFLAAGRRYAAPHHIVEQMVTLPVIAPLPDAHKAVRGVINLRGSVLALVDLRVLFGEVSSEQEMADLKGELISREAEHKAWLLELESSIREGRAFQKGTDPHACAFGRWFDNYDPPSNRVRAVVGGFDGPHKRIHAIAAKAQAIAAEGRRDDALALIEETRSGDLAAMIELFATLKVTLDEGRREIAIVIREGKGAPIAVQVDSVETVEKLEIAAGPEWDGGVFNLSTSVLAGIGRNSAGHFVSILDLKKVIGLTQKRA